MPWSARLIPASCREEIIGDALEELSRRAGMRWRTRLWLHRFLLGAAAAAHAQCVREALQRRTSTGNGGGGMVGRLASEVRFAVRGLARSPGFLVIALLLLAIGTGGVTAMFNVLYGALIRPLPYDPDDRLVLLRTVVRADVIPAASKPDLEDVKANAGALESIGTWRPWPVTVTAPGGEPTRAAAASVDSEYLRLLGARAVIGRVFSPADDAPGHDPVVVLSHGFWRTAYGAEADAIGRTIELDGLRYTIVGVLAADFRDPLAAHFAPEPPPLWRASPPEFANGNRSWRSFWGLARLAEGSTGAAADAQIADLAQRLADTWPDTNADVGLHVRPLREHLVGGSRDTIALLAVAVLFVMLVACANVANLLLARGIARGEEHRLRRALGARRWQVMRPLLVENLVLALAGLVPGLLVAIALTRLFAPWTRDLGRLVDIGMHASVLAGAGAVCVAVVLAFGIAPAWKAAAPERRLLGSHRLVSGPGSRLRSGLVVVEAALAVALLVSAGLLLRSFHALSAVDPGLRTDGGLVATITPSATRHADPPALGAAVASVLEHTRRIPTVRSVGIVSDLPFTGLGNRLWIRRPERPLPAGETPPSVLYRTVAGDYFDAAGIRRVAGRLLDDRIDHAHAASVAVINEALATSLFPGEDPLGRTLVLSGMEREVVGLVRSVREAGPDQSAPPAVYVPYAQETQEWAMRTVTLLASVTADDPLDAARDLRSAILAADATTAINDVRTFDEVAATSTRTQRFRTGLVTVFATIGLVLAALGLGSVVAYHVSQRRRELGLRLALGATRAQVVALIVRDGVALAALGTAAGMLLSLLLGRSLGHLLFGVAPWDPLVLAAVPAAFLGTALVAALLPGARAARMHPGVALRQD